MCICLVDEIVYLSNLTKVLFVPIAPAVSVQGSDVSCLRTRGPDLVCLAGHLDLTKPTGLDLAGGQTFAASRGPGLIKVLFA